MEKLLVYKSIGGDELRMMLKFYLWVMGWSGKINTWAWNKQASIINNGNNTKRLE